MTPSWLPRSAAKGQQDDANRGADRRGEMGCPRSCGGVGSIADPNDPGMLDVVGFDTATPQLVSDFARGTL
jgi:hypothetical protein